MHHGVRWLVEGHIKVLSLLVCACHSSALGSFGEGGGRGADFAVYNFIFECLTSPDRAVEEVLSDVMDDATDFANLLRCQQTYVQMGCAMLDIPQAFWRSFRVEEDSMD